MAVRWDTHACRAFFCVPLLPLKKGIQLVSGINYLGKGKSI